MTGSVVSDRDLRAVTRALRGESWLDTGRVELRGLALRTVPDPRALVESELGGHPIRTVDLSENRLEELPGWVTDLAEVEELNVAGNRLRRLPDSLAGLTRLRVLNASGNRLETLDGLSGCTALIEVDVAANVLTDLTPLAGLPRLRALNAASNRLVHLDRVPALRTLVRLNLSANRLTDVPTELLELPALAWLDLSGNQLTREAIGKVAAASRIATRFHEQNPGSEPDRRIEMLRQHVAAVGYEPGVHYLDAPTYELRLEVPVADAADLRHAVNLFHDRFSDLPVRIQVGGLQIGLESLSRSAAHRVSQRAGSGGSCITISPTKSVEAIERAALFLAEALERMPSALLVTADGDVLNHPGVAGGEAAEPPPPSHRRLIADVYNRGRKCRRAVPPDHDLTLELYVAIPKKGDLFAAADLVIPPTDGPVVDLEIEVTSAVWSKPMVTEIQLPTDPTIPSTSATFTFHSPTTGSALRFDIVARHRGRPLQTAILTVPVNDGAVGHDRIRFLATVTTAGPEPAADSTSAEVSLNALTADLSSGSNAIPLGDVQELLDKLEQAASKTLGRADAPEHLTDENALALLIELARSGWQLGDRLAPLQIAAEGSISLLVHSGTPVLPLELVYMASEAPRKTAKLCPHVTGLLDPPDWGRPCPRVSRHVVCPYAFWGMYRTIVRDVVLPGRKVHAPATLQLRPVLYAAADKVDVNTPSGATPPSDLLEASIRALFGSSVTRVTSWTQWRHCIRARPQLLLLLAHQETPQNEAGLFIGKHSFLSKVDVTTDVVSPAQFGATPLVLLMACATAVAGDVLGTLPGAFVARGAGAVIGTLSMTTGTQGARAAEAVLRALRDTAAGTDANVSTVGDSLARARRSLVADGLLLGLLLVAHGDIDLRMKVG